MVRSVGDPASRGVEIAVKRWRTYVKSKNSQIFNVNYFNFEFFTDNYVFSIVRIYIG